jgi:hypothetical protein
MNNTAYQIWETFKAELIVEPTDDMKEALASSIRVISSLVIISVLFLYTTGDYLDGAKDDY